VQVRVLRPGSPLRLTLIRKAVNQQAEHGLAVALTLALADDPDEADDYGVKLFQQDPYDRSQQERC
jgi:hypothetical protein